MEAQFSQAMETRLFFHDEHIKLALCTCKVEASLAPLFYDIIIKYNNAPI